jgi:homoserine kinase
MRMKEKKIIIKVPASTSNLGPGMDTLGLALTLYNIYEITLTEGEPQVQIIGKGKGVYPENEENLVYQSAQLLVNRVGGADYRFKILIRSSIPTSGGLGGSATARLAGLVGANFLLGNPLTEEDIVDFAIKLEGHPDNVIPAFYGGFTVSCLTETGVKFIRCDFPARLRVVLAIPDFYISTEEARKCLPDRIPFQDVLFNTSRTAILVAALLTGHIDFLSFAMEDRIHQIYRKNLIKPLPEVLEAALKAGAKGCALSGAGSAILALATDKEAQIGGVMKAVFQSYGIKCDVLVLDVDREGLQVQVVEN